MRTTNARKALVHLENAMAAMTALHDETNQLDRSARESLRFARQSAGNSRAAIAAIYEAIDAFNAAERQREEDAA